MFDRLLRQAISLITVTAVLFLAAISFVLLIYGAFTVILALVASPTELVLESLFLALALSIVAVGVADLSLTIYQEEIVRRDAMRAAVVSADTVARFLFVVITIIAIHNVLLVVRSEVQRNLMGLIVATGMIIATAILVAAAAYYQRGISQARRAAGVTPGRRGGPVQDGDAEPSDQPG